MWAIVSALGVVVFLLLLSDLRVWKRKEKGQGDQDKRDRGELPHDYFGKEK